ncbi:dnaJ domain-containing protein [Phthorimaea operculella]|nr:dnaJ domain-containing protein [Phthorimaea operculella]
MDKSIVTLLNLRLFKRPQHALCKQFCSQSTNTKELKTCYKLLNIPMNSDQETVREAFLSLAKKYHPDSGSPQACIDKFVEIENAFRILTRHNTGQSCKKEVEKIVYDIRHTAPQHRQYLSFEGVGVGTPYQREKQWQAARAQRAAENVMEHRLAKSVATEGTLMVKGQGIPSKHDIKTKYGFDRLVEDLIQESMSKGEFKNLSGKGKPLKDHNTNPYVDFTTHKLNEVLINNGFTPEWITLKREIENDIEALKKELEKDRMVLGPYPFEEPGDETKWEIICENNRELAKSINMRINKFNLIVPLMAKQKFYVQFDEMCEEILKSGPHSQESLEARRPVQVDAPPPNTGEDILSLLYKGLTELFSFGKKNSVKN